MVHSAIPADLIVQAVNAARDAIVIADVREPGFPLVYVNRGFENLTGYTAGEAIGKSLHFLQGDDAGQPEAAAISAAIAGNGGCVVTLRNYRKDGSMFWNETSISPLPDAKAAPAYLIGIQKDVTASILLDQRLTCADPLAGVGGRRQFDQRFSDALVFAKRAHCGMSLLIIELDSFSRFIERYGQPGGDECLCRVGDCIAKSFLRMSDCVARYGDGEIAAVSLSFGAGSLRQHAQKLCEQVRKLDIPHSGSQHGVVTVSIGGVHIMPIRETTEEMLVKVAGSKLQAAKRNGGNSALVIG